MAPPKGKLKEHWPLQDQTHVSRCLSTQDRLSTVITARIALPA